MTTDGVPIAYSGLNRGTPVVSASGRKFGTLERVLEIPEQDLFDGIVVATDDGLRFVDRDQIDEITTTHVRCALSDGQVAALRPPDGPPVFAVEDPGFSLRDRFARLFRRPRWTRKR